MYFGYARLDITVYWVQCDNCDWWIHEHYETSSSESFNETFIYKIGSMNTGEYLLAIEWHNLALKFNQYLDSLVMTEDKLLKLKMNTRKQRSSQIWVDERKTRLTASLFARVCKCKVKTDYQSIVNAILSPRNISRVPSIKHGIDNKDNAIAAYARS